MPVAVEVTVSAVTVMLALPTFASDKTHGSVRAPCPQPPVRTPLAFIDPCPAPTTATGRGVTVRVTVMGRVNPGEGQSCRRVSVPVTVPASSPLELTVTVRSALPPAPSLAGITRGKGFHCPPPTSPSQACVELSPVTVQASVGCVLVTVAVKRDSDPSRLCGWVSVKSAGDTRIDEATTDRVTVDPPLVMVPLGRA
jgi:hypothetical protein